MKTFNPEQLAEILGRHKLWLDDEAGGLRADLRGADLRGADLRDADLRGA
ncbi:pentapeptide repeat-containing protein, partial [Pseudomonas protegens]